MKCPLVENEEIVEGEKGRFRCPICGWKYHKMVVRECDGRPLLGDMVARVTKWFGVNPCRGCKSRQKWLNERHEATIELVNRFHLAVRRRLDG
jgi:hypothetical protein